MPQPIARWSPSLDCWIECDDETESLFSVPSAVFSGILPTSGMTRDGTAYELPTSVPATPGSASLSPPPDGVLTRGGSGSPPKLMPTPEAKLGSSGPDYARATRAGTGADSLHETVGRLTGALPPE